MLTLYEGHALDVLRTLPADSVQCCVTSPPYFGLRAYGTAPVAWPDGWQGHLGLEPSPLLYIQHLVAIFGAVRRVLRPDGVCWVNIADSFAAKNLLLIPQRLAIALQDDGWTVRQVFPWVKRNAMPGSQQDRATTALEWWLMLTKRARYFCDMEAVRQTLLAPTGGRQRRVLAGELNGERVPRGEPTGTAQLDDKPYDPAGRTYRNTDLWLQSLEAPYGLVGVGEELVGLDVPTQPYGGDHYATFSVDLIAPLLRMGTSAQGACSVCGAPWQRVVTRHSTQEQPSWRGSDRKNGCPAGGGHAGRTGMWTATTTQTAWAPPCAHVDAPRVPCVVLDPFAGRMTTLLAAQRLGLHGLAIELNPQDMQHGAARLRADAPLLAQVHIIRTREEETTAETMM